MERLKRAALLAGVAAAATYKSQNIISLPRKGIFEHITDHSEKPSNARIVRNDTQLNKSSTLYLISDKTEDVVVDVLEKKIKNCCEECGWETFAIQHDAEGVEICEQCAYIRESSKQVREDDDITGILHSNCSFRYTGGGITRERNDQIIYEINLRMQRQKADYMTLPDSLLSAVAQRLANRSILPGKKRTLRLFARVMIDVAAEQLIPIDKHKIASMFLLQGNKLISGHTGKTIRCPRILAIQYLTDCVSLATRWKTCAPEGFIYTKELQILSCMLNSDLRGEKLYIEFITECVAISLSLGKCRRRQISTRILGACGLLILCLGYPTVQLLADSSGKRKAAILGVAKELSNAWQNFQSVHDHCGVPYPDVIEARLMTRREASASQDIVKLYEQHKDKFPELQRLWPEISKRQLFAC